jgi:integrase
MSERIKVSVVEFADRRHYMMQWRDPVTGRKKSKSTKVERTGQAKDRKEAERVAAKFEAELREGRYHEPLRVTWADFRERYEMEGLSGLAVATDNKVAALFNWVERVMNPTRLADVTESRVSHLQADMRRAGLSENTIKSYMHHLTAALNWGCRLGLLLRVPKVERLKRAKGSKVMKGRPITGEEFDRLLAAAPKVLDSRTRGRKPLPPEPAVVESWRYLLRGLWLSGLRLGEALELWWDRDDRLCVDLTGKLPMLRIPAECEKGHQDRLLPLAPEFAEFLLATPEAERTGPVFKPLARRVHGERLGAPVVSAIICKIGEAAGVKVATDPRSGRVKFASAHDLRRSFGERWAARIMPTDLMALMRHETIETTLRYYVGRNAQNTAKTLWEAYRKAGGGNTLGNSDQTGPKVAIERADVTHDAESV